MKKIMTREEKQLLLTDLCARLPFGIKILDMPANVVGDPFLVSTTDTVEYEPADETNDDIGYQTLYNIKLYLRPMSSMTEEERDEIEEMSHGWFYVNEDGEIFPVGQLTDSGEFEDAILPTLEWLDKKMFDFRGLIPMGLALEAPEDMYKN